MKRISLILSFVLFILLCVSASFWVMQFMKSEPRKISAPPVTRPVANVESVAGLFGGALAVNSNYQLKGIVLANPQNQSEAIIAVDGKPSQAFTVNTEISPGVKVAEVQAGYILILDNGVSKRLELPQDSKSGLQADDNYPTRSPLPAGANLTVPDNSFAPRANRGRTVRRPADAPPNPTPSNVNNPDALVNPNPIPNGNANAGPRNQ